MSTPGCSAASKLATRVARGDQVGALVADASQRALSAAGIARAPVCRAVGVALAARQDPRRRSAGTAARPAVDARLDRVGSLARRRAASAGAPPRSRASASASATSDSRAPRVDRRLPAALGLPDVPDPGDVALVEQRVADRARRVVGAQPAQEPRERRTRSASTSGPSAASRWSKRRAALGHQLEHRAVELDHLVTARAQHQPRPARRPPPAPARPGTRPRPRSSRRCEWMHQVALEVQEQVLAVRADLARPRGPPSRSGQRSSAWRGCGVRISSGTRPSSTGRIRLAA